MAEYKLIQENARVAAQVAKSNAEERVQLEKRAHQLAQFEADALKQAETLQGQQAMLQGAIQDKAQRLKNNEAALQHAEHMAVKRTEEKNGGSALSIGNITAFTLIVPPGALF